MPLVEVENATLVHISVNQKVDGDYQYVISMFPNRHGETATFHAPDPKERTMGRPTEVVWVGHGLSGNMRILIEAKEGARGRRHMNDDFVLTEAKPWANSNAVQLQGMRTVHWTYGIRLVDAAGKDIARPVDPDVIINHDP